MDLPPKFVRKVGDWYRRDAGFRFILPNLHLAAGCYRSFSDSDSSVEFVTYCLVANLRFMHIFCVISPLKLC